jgi:hypothetical protein
MEGTCGSLTRRLARGALRQLFGLTASDLGFYLAFMDRSGFTPAISGCRQGGGGKTIVV